MTHGQLFGARWKELAKTFLKLGATSFGGPAIIGIIQAELQERRGWLTRERFLEGLAVVNMLPGGAVMQLCIFIGYQRAGWRGGVLAGLSFLLPPFCIMLALTLLYASYGRLPVVRDALYGLGPVVLGIFVVTACRLGTVALTNLYQLVIACVAAVMLAFTPVGIIGILLLAGCTGIALYHSATWGLRAALPVSLSIVTWHLAGTVFAPSVEPLFLSSDREPGLISIGAFFASVGAFTFGGGITIVAFVQEQVVNQLQWLTPQEFLDGIALGQLAPGPVLMLATYVGYKLCGIPGALVGQLAIYVPSFAVMLSILPALARFREILWIKAAMRGIGAAVIGVVSVSLFYLAPYAAPDAFAATLLVLTVLVMLAMSIRPFPLILAGALVGIAAGTRPLQQLRKWYEAS
jgi:chromate transporter